MGPCAMYYSASNVPTTKAVFTSITHTKSYKVGNGNIRDNGDIKNKRCQSAAMTPLHSDKPCQEVGERDDTYNNALFSRSHGRY